MQGTHEPKDNHLVFGFSEDGTQVTLSLKILQIIYMHPSKMISHQIFTVSEGAQLTEL